MQSDSARRVVTPKSIRDRFEEIVWLLKKSEVGKKINKGAFIYLHVRGCLNIRYEADFCFVLGARLSQKSR